MAANLGSDPKRFKHLWLTGTTNPIPIDLNWGAYTEIRNIWLLGYVIKGAPVTGSVPDSPIFNMQFDNLNASANVWIRNDGNGSAVPLIVSGSYTAVQLAKPLHVCNSSAATQEKFHLVVKDTAGNPATYTYFGVNLFIEHN